MVIFFFLLMMHFIGDFYLKMFGEKINNKILNHTKGIDYDKSKISKFIFKCTEFIVDKVTIGLLYIVPYFLCFFILKWQYSLLLISLIFVAHFIIDFFSYVLKQLKVKRFFIFLIDQFIHAGILFVFKELFSFYCYKIAGFEKLIYVITIVLFLIKPSIDIVRCIYFDTFNSEDEKKTTFDTGAVIGVFERLITLVLMVFNATIGVGIIITIKTWARTNDIKNNNDNFGNKYLVGTLVSITLALISGYALYTFIN